jgi:DNA-binding NarL/FixJ family response regulator
MTTVLIADDQALVRVGLRKILESDSETTVVGEAGDGEYAVAETRRLRPDVVLMPETRVLILTTSGSTATSTTRSMPVRVPSC